MAVLTEILNGFVRAHLAVTNEIKLSSDVRSEMQVPVFAIIERCKRFLDKVEAQHPTKKLVTDCVQTAVALSNLYAFLFCSVFILLKTCLFFLLIYFVCYFFSDSSRSLSCLLFLLLVRYVLF